MKFKCGKCGELNEAQSGKDTPDGFVIVACRHCYTNNKLSRSKIEEPVLPKEEFFAHTIAVNISKSPVTEEQPLSPGWIFVHDENAPKQCFDLKSGKNIIGRRSSVSVDIPIYTNDEYMSRRHCMIEINPNQDGGYEFLLSDFKALNGTFINGVAKKRLGTGDIFLLNDGDTIQLGMTKVVIRINNKQTNKEQVQAEINNSGYAPTMIVSRK